ncbi:MAG TPA: hypothetical protein VN452_07520 [Longilinea sp.]|nr:hypothetical protein [Longilinea sp.]
MFTLPTEKKEGVAALPGQGTQQMEYLHLPKDGDLMGVPVVTTQVSDMKSARPGTQIPSLTSIFETKTVLLVFVGSPKTVQAPNLWLSCNMNY